MYMVMLFVSLFAGFVKANEVNVDDFVLWQQEMQNRLRQEKQFLQELHKHKYIAGDGTQSSSRHGGRLYSTGDSDSYIKTDEESYFIKTDEEDDQLNNAGTGSRQICH